MSQMSQMEGQKCQHPTLVKTSPCRRMARLIQVSDYLRHLRIKPPF
jgi:hypothetical protein